MSAATEPRWYVLNSMHMATLCADKADAEDVARTCDMEWPRQSPHRAVQLVEAPKIHYPTMADPVAWMWRVADSDWQLESTCPPERPLAIVEPLYTGYMADAYIGAREEVEIWRRRALEAEKKLHAEIARLTAENKALRAKIELIDYVLQDNLHNRLTPRVVDIAYSAFASGRGGRSEDGEPCDWFNDTKPRVVAWIDKIKKDLADEAAYGIGEKP